jgi:hypothetical protein
MARARRNRLSIRLRHSLRGTAMDLSWTCRPPTVDFGTSALLRAWGQTTLLPAHPLGESHSQTEGFQAEDRHNPLPHIPLLTTAPKSAYRNTASLSTRTADEQQELLIPAAGNSGLLGCSFSSADVAGLREVCYRAKAAAFQAG